MAGYYDDEDDVDIHFRHRSRSPGPVRYVQSPPRPRYYGAPARQEYLYPDQQHMTIVARSRSHERVRNRQDSSPAAPANPVIINNRIYNDYSSDEEEDDRRSSRHGGRRRSRSRSRSRSRTPYMTRDDWEAEQARRDLDELRLVHARERGERRLEKKYEDEAEFQRLKSELGDIRQREAHAEEEKRIKRELEFKRLQEEEQAAEAEEKAKEAAAAAVEKYKKDQLEKIAKEEKQKKERDAEYKRRMQDDLLASGLDEKSITAIMNKKKVTSTAEPEQPAGGRPTYTRMARRHLSIETLRYFHIEYDLDADPEYLVVKRWVPEWEQDQMWIHTKHVRERRGGTLMIEEKKHHRHEPQFEWVRKKSDRKRSKSPAYLQYFAGVRPA